MASIASALQFVQTTLKDPLKVTPESSPTRSAWGSLALGLATAAGTIGIAALAKKSGASFEPAQEIGAAATSQDQGAPGGGGAAPKPQEPGQRGERPAMDAGKKAQGYLLLAGISVFALAVILWAVTSRRKG